MPAFPEYRARRLRRSDAIRRLVRETEVLPSDLILPLFVRPGNNLRRAIGSMPGVFQTSIDESLRDAEDAAGLGVGAVILFGLPESKEERGSEGYADDGIVQSAVRELKKSLPDVVVMADVCLFEYTSHGHCGVINEGVVQNDETIELLARQAVSHARAGADIVAPSDMMDGRVGAIRAALDRENFSEVAILSYAAKYASAFYG